jgi:hypothetical protein
VALPGRTRVTSEFRTLNDHLGYPSPPEHALLVTEAPQGSILNKTKPTKPRCEVSCRGLRGTGLVNSQCREQSPRGTGQHPVLFMLSTRKGLRMVTFYIPITRWSTMETKSTKTTGPNDLKKERDPPPRRSLGEILQQGAGSSGASLRGPVATSEPAAEISAKGRDRQVLRNLPEVKPGTSFLGVSDTDTPLQGASISSLPAAGG